MTSGAKNSALFICLGNICRSPIAAAVFKHVAKEMGVADNWNVDSAAIGSWHVGNPADPRAQKTLKNHDIDPKHSARQIKTSDFNQYDYIFGMDEENMKALKRMAPSNSKAKLCLLGSFDPNGEKIIRDPYYDNDDIGFEKCYEQCLRSCKGFLEQDYGS
ncbi:low molecular weight phosphotyrosine protein phosphatase 1-like [Lycorma delicatula]|uniref:low molecular weight phosphotyrosine protein phosphatase 1-like n=1 Tax=Lycorma delicatula TaxID=130591 RepID=UPI003F5182F1